MKKSEFKKKLSLLLAATMCLSICACGNKEAEGTKETNETQQDTDKQNSEESSGVAKNYWDMLDEVSDTSELPDWTGETLEVSIWVAGGTDAILGSISDTNVAFKELERVTGVRFNVDDSFTNGGDNIDAMLPRVVASNNIPTMIMGWDIGNQLQELYDNGYLADLTEYYENGDLDQLEYWIPLDEFDQSIYSEAKAADGSYYLIPQPASMCDAYASSDYQPEEFDTEYYSKYNGTVVSATNLASYYAIYVRDDILQTLYPDALSMEDIKNIYVEEGTYTEEQIFDISLSSAQDFFDLLYDIKDLLAESEFKGLNGKDVEVTYGPNSETDNWSWMTFCQGW